MAAHHLRIGILSCNVFDRRVGINAFLKYTLSLLNQVKSTPVYY